MTELTAVRVLVYDLLQSRALVENPFEHLLQISLYRVHPDCATFDFDELDVWQMLDFLQNFLHALRAIANIQLPDLVFVGLQVLNHLDVFHLRRNVQNSVLELRSPCLFIGHVNITESLTNFGKSKYNVHCYGSRFMKQSDGEGDLVSTAKFRYNLQSGIKVNLDNVVILGGVPMFLQNF